MAMPQEPVLVVVDAPALLVASPGPAEVDVGADLCARTVARRRCRRDAFIEV